MYHTPSKFSIPLLFTTVVGVWFERDTEYILGNRTLRIKVISHSRDSGIDVSSQSIYIEYVRKLPELGSE